MYKKLIGKNIGYGANEQNSLLPNHYQVISSESLFINFFSEIFFAIILPSLFNKRSDSTASKYSLIQNIILA
jgi:hypothetical protein